MAYKWVDSSEPNATHFLPTGVGNHNFLGGWTTNAEGWAETRWVYSWLSGYEISAGKESHQLFVRIANHYNNLVLSEMLLPPENSGCQHVYPQIFAYLYQIHNITTKWKEQVLKAVNMGQNDSEKSLLLHFGVVWNRFQNQSNVDHLLRGSDGVLWWKQLPGS